MIARELHCTPTEAKARTTPQEFLNYIEFWKTNPRLEDHINVCMAQICQMIFNTNIGRGQRPKKLEKFIVDYKKALLPSKSEVVQKIKNVFGALAKR